jgi:hypothetical protein
MIPPSSAASITAAASGRAHYQLTRQAIKRLADALKKWGVDIVPRVQISAGAGGSLARGRSTAPTMAVIVSVKDDLWLWRACDRTASERL